MARKEVNVFGASFLDLLSGALGAVIILYIIVPKLTITAAEYEEQAKLAEEVQALGLSIDALSSLIPQEELAALQAQMERIEQARADLERQISAIQQALEQCLASSSECETRVQQLEQQVQQLQAQLQQTQQELQQAQQQIQQTQQQLAQSQAELSRCESELAGCPDTVEEIEGDQRFIIVNLDWRSQYHDVDLHVIDPAGNEFKYNARTFRNVPGEMTVDNTCGPGFEVWQIISPRPGRYQIYANFYGRRGGQCESGETGPPTSPIKLSIFHRNGIRDFTRTLTRTGADAKELITTVVVDNDGVVTIQ